MFFGSRIFVLFSITLDEKLNDTVILHSIVVMTKGNLIIFKIKVMITEYLNLV